MNMNSIHTTDNPDEAGRQKKDGEIRLPVFCLGKASPGDYHVEGDLTIKGITQPIEFTATINTKTNTSHITANVDISHQLWDIGQKTHDKHRLDSLSAIREKLVPRVHVSLDIMMNK